MFLENGEGSKSKIDLAIKNDGNDYNNGSDNIQDNYDYFGTNKDCSLRCI